MNDQMTFPTKAAARAEIGKMAGWDAKAVKLADYDPETQQRRDVWVIQCDGDKYLRADGYVR